MTAKRTPLPTIRPFLRASPLPGNAFTDTLLSNAFLQQFITEYMNNYKYFSYATYIQTKFNQYNNAVKEAYGYSSLLCYWNMNFVILSNTFSVLLNCRLKQVEQQNCKERRWQFCLLIMEYTLFNLVSLQQNIYRANCSCVCTGSGAGNRVQGATRLVFAGSDDGWRGRGSLGCVPQLVFWGPTRYSSASV
jgi:hypothetical protein